MPTDVKSKPAKSKPAKPKPAKPKPINYSVRRLSEEEDLSHSKIYRMINAGELRIIKIGSMTRITNVPEWRASRPTELGTCNTRRRGRVQG